MVQRNAVVVRCPEGDIKSRPLLNPLPFPPQPNSGGTHTCYLLGVCSHHFSAKPTQTTDLPAAIGHMLTDHIQAACLLACNHCPHVVL